MSPAEPVVEDWQPITQSAEGRQRVAIVAEALRTLGEDAQDRALLLAEVNAALLQAELEPVRLAELRELVEVVHLGAQGDGLGRMAQSEQQPEQPYEVVDPPDPEAVINPRDLADQHDRRVRILVSLLEGTYIEELGREDERWSARLRLHRRLNAALTAEDLARIGVPRFLGEYREAEELRATAAAAAMAGKIEDWRPEVDTSSDEYRARTWEHPQPLTGYARSFTEAHGPGRQR